MMVGAFTAVASTPCIWQYGRLNARVNAPYAMRPLPPAVLVHVGHELDAKIAGPVGIAVPSFVEGRIEVEVVLASTAKEASDRIRSGHLAAVSIVVGHYPVRHWRDLNRECLLAVDLVPKPADRQALLGRITYDRSMSEGQRRTQARLDAHIAVGALCQLDIEAFFAEVGGLEAFDALAPIVEPLRAEHQPIAC